MEKKTQVPQIKQKNIPILIFFRRQDLGKKSSSILHATRISNAACRFSFFSIIYFHLFPLMIDYYDLIWNVAIWYLFTILITNVEKQLDFW